MTGSKFLPKAYVEAPLRPYLDDLYIQMYYRRVNVLVMCPVLWKTRKKQSFQT